FLLYVLISGPPLEEAANYERNSSFASAARPVPIKQANAPSSRPTPVRAPAPVVIGTVERPCRAAACPWGRPPSRGASSPLHAADLQKSRRELGARTLVFVLEEDVRFRPRLRLDPLGPRLQL